MRKQLGLMTLFLTLATIQLIVPWAPSLAVTTTDPERQIADLPVVKKEILDTTRYDEANLDVVIKDNQFVVTIINSKLNEAPSTERNSEASIIVSAITKAIYSRPEFGSIIGIHVDYVTRAPGANHFHTNDGIDFRKDPAGNFVHHIT